LIGGDGDAMASSSVGSVGSSSFSLPAIANSKMATINWGKKQQSMSDEDAVRLHNAVR